MRASHGEGVHFRYNVHAQLITSSPFLTAQDFTAFGYFKRVSTQSFRERLSMRPLSARRLFSPNDAPTLPFTCESLCVVKVLHERAAAVLYVMTMFSARSKAF